MARCNSCGKLISEMKDFLQIKKNWGYFSKHDLEQHKFLMCEECYDKLVKSFRIPVDVADIDTFGRVVSF